MIRKVSQCWALRKTKGMIDELLKQSRESYNKAPRVEVNPALFAVYLDRFSTGEQKKRFEANLYGGIHGAWRIGSAFLFLPIFETGVFAQKATEVYWHRFFSSLAVEYALPIFLPQKREPLIGTWYHSAGSAEGVKAIDAPRPAMLENLSGSPTSRIFFCELAALKDPLRLSELKQRNADVVVLYTPEIPRDLEIFAGGRSLQFDLFFLVIAPKRVYVTGPSVWGADRPYFNQDFHLQREAELFTCHIPLGLPKFGNDNDYIERGGNVWK